jgi:hypothetical protein
MLCRAPDRGCDPAGSIKAISAVSGGAVGAYYYLAAYDGGSLPEDLTPIVERASAPLEDDVWRGLIYRDVFRPLTGFLPRLRYSDRASAFDEALRRPLARSPHLGEWRRDVAEGVRPAFLLSATEVEGGRRLVFSTGGRIDAPMLVNFGSDRLPGRDIDMATAVRLASTFPIVAPAARADTADPRERHIVDGGYFDQYGVETLIDWLQRALAEGPSGDVAATSVAAPIDRVLIVQIVATPPDQDRPTWSGWIRSETASVEAPLTGSLAAQLARNEHELRLLHDAWQGRVNVSSVVLQLCDAPSIAWHVTQRQRLAIDDQWRTEASGPAVKSILDFLMHPEIELPPYAGPRCASPR